MGTCWSVGVGSWCIAVGTCWCVAVGTCWCSVGVGSWCISSGGYLHGVY